MRSCSGMAILFTPKTLLFWLVCGLVILGACESEVPIPPMPATKPKLVLFSLISPEVQGVQVSVTRTVPLQTKGNTTQPSVVTDALVFLSDGQDTLLVPFVDSLQAYMLPRYAVKPNQQYWLWATTPDGTSAKAQCYVPARINQSLTVTIDSTSTSGGAATKSYVVQLDWQDLTGSGDFYKIDASLVTQNTQFPSFHTTYGVSMLDVPLARDYQADGRKWQRRSEILPTDKLASINEKPDSVYAYLLTTDQPYFDFHNSLYKFRSNSQNVSNFSEPTSIYTNIEGGFGLFAAYRSYKIRLKF